VSGICLMQFSFVFKVSLSKQWSRCRYSMICWIFSEHFFEWCQLQFCAVSAGDSFWAAVWSDLCWHRREIYDRYFCWGDKLGFVSLKLCSDICHNSVICNNYFYCAWPIPVPYLGSADPQWMNLTACVWAVLWLH